jgi:uncharacterized membrane protein
MNEFTTSLIQGVIVPLLAIWIVGFGAFYIVGKQGTYLSLSRRFIVRPVQGVLKRLWNRYKKEIILLVIGIALGVWIMKNFTAASF